MSIFNIFKRPQPHNPEDDFVITVTSTGVKVEHPQRKPEQILWSDIREIKLVNTDQGPSLPDIWLVLMGEGQDSGCVIPHGTKGFDMVFEIISKYEGFDMDSFVKSMACSGNQEFPLWKKS